jgi:hypothetical protein
MQLQLPIVFFLMFVVPYILVTNVFILVQLNVQFLMFLKRLLAQHVSDVTASIVWSTTVVFTTIGFWILVCLFRATCVGVGPHRHCIAVSFRPTQVARNKHTRNQKPMALKTTVVLLTMVAVTSEKC